MSEYEPNREQGEFIETLGKNLLVSASAGSGKTSTMIKKLSAILQKEQPITSLLVVTYTNAAASEMRLKLYNELNKVILDENSTCNKEFLKAQLDNIGNAEIGTLHAICKKLIVKYFYELGESPDFNLLLEKEQTYLLDMAVNNVIGEYIKKSDDEFFELYDCYNSNRSDTQLKQIALQLYNFKTAKTDYIDWKNNFLKSTYNENLNDNIACTYLLEYYQKELLNFSSQIFSLINEAKNCSFDKYLPYLNCRRQFVDEFNKSPDFVTSVKIMANIDGNFIDKPRSSKNMSAEESVFDEKIAKFGEYFGKLFKEIKTNYTSLNVDEIQSNILRAKKNVIKLMDLVDQIEKNYTYLKKKKNVLDFNDLEDKMLLLLESEKIRTALREQYKYVFVDEYQDINEKQEKILLQLVSENNYYMIGDVKQSIYAFRQSSPEIFINKYNSFSKTNPNSKVIKFNVNYRSDKNILEFCNDIFDKIITKTTIGIDYEKEARFQSENKFLESNVSLNIINEQLLADEKEILEAQLVAEEVRRIMTLTKSDGKKFDFGDIAIILKDRGAFVNTLCELFAKLQIPVKASVKTNFFQTSEVQLLIGILKCLSNYQDDVSLSIVLKNLFDVSEYELMNIRASNPDVNFYQAVKEYSDNEKIVCKINKCFDFIDTFTKLSTRMTISELLYKIVDDFDILVSAKTRKGGTEKVNNILDFIAITDNENYKYNFDKFLDYLEIVSKSDTPKIIGESNNAVEICTIHHSKGLEYPAVILCKAGNQFTFSKDSGNVIMNGKFGVGLKSIDGINRTLNETVVRNACKIDNKKSQLNELIRLLYVALTRAKEKLSIVGTYDLNKYAENRRKNIYYASSFLDMIFKGVDTVYNSNFANKKNFKINEGKTSEAVVSVYKNEDLIDDGVLVANPVVLDKDITTLKKKLICIYKNAPVYNQKTIKNSVTSILKEESDYENLNFIPKNLDRTDKIPDIDVLKLGTAYHTVMQNINFDENEAEISEIINTLVKSYDIDKEYAENIKVSEIKKAIEVTSPFIQNADSVYKEKQFLLCDNYNKLVGFTDNNTKVIVQGVIDLAIVKDGKACIIDYKTNRGITPEKLTNEYSLQLSLYAKAFEEATGLKVEHKYLYSFYLGQLIEVI